MTNWRTWAILRGRTRGGNQRVFDGYDQTTGAKITPVNDAATARYKAKQDSIVISKANIEIDKENRQASQEAAVKRARIRARAQKNEAMVAAAVASSDASLQTSNTSRLLAEFESERSQRRALFQRKEDQAVGLASAGFQATGIESLGAQSEAVRESNLERIIFESQANQQKERTLQVGRNAVQSALGVGARSAASIRSANASVAAAQVSPKFQDRLTSEFNPYQPTTLWQKGGHLPFVEKGF